MIEEFEFVKVCKLSDLKENAGRQIFINDVEVALFKVAGKVYALSNICPHQKTHLMHEGFIENDNVVCPVHGWMFELSTGNLAKGRKGLDSYEVKILDDEVYVKVFEKKIIW